MNDVLGVEYTNLSSAINEIISRNVNLNRSNQDLNLLNQSLESMRLRFEPANRNLAIELNRVQNENIGLRENIQNWADAYRNLEVQYNNQSTVHINALTLEENRRARLEDYLEELDLEVLLHTINEALGTNYTSLHSGVHALIRDIGLLDDEREEALDFINEALPDNYDSYTDLGAAIAAFYQYYEDSVEELLDE